MTTIVSPSLLSADFGILNQEIDMINNSDAEWLHLDIMDGVFVPNLTFGVPVLKYVAERCTKKLDVHFMTVDPDKYLESYSELDPYMFNVHYEACTHLHRSIQNIKNNGLKAGVTLNPHSPVSVLEDIINDVDMVLLMGVNPGFGGQKFIQNTVNKTAALKELILRKNSNALIQIDGGVNFETGKALKDAGADILVSGSFIFGSDNPIETISKLKNL